MPRGALRAVLLLALCATAARAEGQQARVERRGPAEAAAEPGAALTIPFRVTNLGGAPAVLPGRAALPAGWRATGGGGAGALAAGQAELRLVGLVVPAGTAAGRHVVRYEAGGAADSAIVRVAERRGFTVEALDPGATAIAGRPYAVRFRIANAGNVAEQVRVRVDGDQGLAPAADPSSLRLEPGADAVVTARGETNGRATGSVRHQLTLHAEGAADTVAGRTMLVVIPRGGARAERARLPAEVRVRAADSLSAGSLALSVHGPLDPRGRYRLDVEAHTGDPAGAPFARSDEYSLRLQGPGFGLRLGDGVYALSRLTEPGRYGFGAGAEVSRGWLSAGAMASRDRRGYGTGGAAGGFARLGSARARLGLAYVASDSSGARWTVQGVAEPHRLLRVEAEAAPGETGETGAASGPPRALHVRGMSRALSYELLHLRGAPSYRGGRSADQDFALVTLRPFGALALSVSERRGMDGLVLGDSVHLPRAFRRASASWGRGLLVEVREAAGDTAAPGDYRAVHGRLGIGLPGNGWLNPGLEAGQVVVDPSAPGVPYVVYSLHSTLSGRGASFWGQVQLREGASPYHGGSRELSGALSAQATVLPWTVLRVSAHGRRIDDGPLGTSLDLALERGLPGKHRVSVRALAVSRPLQAWQPRFYVEYALPLGIPLPARGGGDQLVARVVDAATGRGMPDVLVQAAGRVALTDRRGVAALAGIPAGTHALRVTTGGTVELVARGGLPRTVSVGAGGASRVEIEVHAAARITGTVERTGTDSVTAPLGGVAVLLTGPGGEHRTVADARGRFAVTGLWPGWWRVSVDPASLPRHHVLDGDSHVLLQPGGSGESWLRVVEKVRPIQMIQGGVLAPAGTQP